MGSAGRQNHLPRLGRIGFEFFKVYITSSLQGSSLYVRRPVSMVLYYHGPNLTDVKRPREAVSQAMQALTAKQGLEARLHEPHTRTFLSMPGGRCLSLGTTDVLGWIRHCGSPPGRCIVSRGI